MTKLKGVVRAANEPPHLRLSERPAPGETILDDANGPATVVNVNGRGRKWLHLRVQGRVVFCTWEVEQ